METHDYFVRNFAIWSSALSLAWFMMGTVLGFRLARERKPPRKRRTRPKGKGAGDGSRDGKSPDEIYVGNLSFDVDEKTLRRICSRYGRVISVRIVQNRSRGGSKGYGFVRMATPSEGRALVSGLKDKEIKGRRVTVGTAKSRPRRKNRGGRSGRGGSRERKPSR